MPKSNMYEKGLQILVFLVLLHSKSGASYLLTVMCRSTHYPSAYHLHTITAWAEGNALSLFIPLFRRF